MAGRIKVLPDQDDAGEPEQREPAATADSPLPDVSDAAVRKMIAQAKSRGYVTSQQFNSVMLAEEFTSEQIEDILAMLNGMGINVVESEAA